MLLVTMSVGAIDAAMSADDVNVALLLAGVVVGAVSDASSEITTVSWKSISIPGRSVFIADVGVVGCCFCAASSAAV